MDKVYSHEVLAKYWRTINGKFSRCRPAQAQPGSGKGALEIEAVKAPEWAGFVKTGVSKDRPPVDRDWWYKRTASILLNVAKIGPVGTNKLRVRYGSRKNQGHQPAEFRKASGNIIRKGLQQLESAELIKKEKKGRIITAAGEALVAKAAKQTQNA